LSEEKPRENKRFEAEHTEEKRRAHGEESARFKFGQIKDWAKESDFSVMSRGRIRTVLEMIKFEHSVFALPFALTGALLAARATRNGWPTPRQFLWIVVAMVAARSAAMTMNRIVDLRYDRGNPRTRQRALVTGALSLEFAWLFAFLALTVFFVAAWQLNPLALKLAPLAIATLFFYSFTKRFTNWSHVFLGFALGISPAAAWIAITGALDWRMLILCGAVTVWVGGFDVLYACQDIDYDKEAGLFSIPKQFGIAKALLIARGMHIGVIALLSWLALSFGLPWPAWAGIAVVAALLTYEHSLLKADDLSKLDAAFFTVNGYISMLFLLFWGAAAAFWRV
jgi:4-hydroxybenzoate polyprenyltransferase